MEEASFRMFYQNPSYWGPKFWQYLDDHELRGLPHLLGVVEARQRDKGVISLLNGLKSRGYQGKVAPAKVGPSGGASGGAVLAWHRGQWCHGC